MSWCAVFSYLAEQHTTQAGAAVPTPSGTVTVTVTAAPAVRKDGFAAASDNTARSVLPPAPPPPQQQQPPTQPVQQPAMHAKPAEPKVVNLTGRKKHKPSKQRFTNCSIA